MQRRAKLSGEITSVKTQVSDL